MTLFPTLVFAEFERSKPEFANLEREDGHLSALRFKVGIERLDTPDTAEKKDLSDPARYMTFSVKRQICPN